MAEIPSAAVEKAHSDLGPSSAHRWMNCAGSVRLSAGLPDDKTPFAAEGTVAHGLAEELVTGKVDSLDLMGRVGDTVEQDGFEVEITEEMVDGAVEYHDAILADKVALGSTPGSSEVREMVETRVGATSIDAGLWGTLDHALYKKGQKLIIRDYKFGKGKAVSPEENEQLGIYAIGVMDTLDCWAFGEVELVINQPRNGGESRWATSVEWLRGLQERLRKAVAATDAKDAPLSPGDWCRWCRAKPTCPALYGAVQEAAKADFAMTPPPPSGDTKSTAGLPDVERMPISKLAAALEWEDAINSWFESVKLRLRAELEAGRDVPGFKLVEGRANRVWLSEEAMLAKYTPVLGTEALYAPRKVKSVAQVEKLVGKKAFDHGLTLKPEGKKSIAKSSDPRPEAKRTAVEDFSNVNTDAAMAEL